jgi:hypothetical protein
LVFSRCIDRGIHPAFVEYGNTGLNNVMKFIREKILIILLIFLAIFIASSAYLTEKFIETEFVSIANEDAWLDFLRLREQVGCREAI